MDNESQEICKFQEAHINIGRIGFTGDLTAMNFFLVWDLAENLWDIVKVVHRVSLASKFGDDFIQNRTSIISPLIIIVKPIRK